MIRHKAVYRGGSGEIVEKKSRFIANIKSVETVEEAQVYIEEMKKKYWDARHNCSAFSVGTEQVTTRCSDDGEPSGTAGKPILEVISGSGKNTSPLWWKVTKKEWQEIGEKVPETVELPAEHIILLKQ